MGPRGPKDSAAPWAFGDPWASGDPRPLGTLERGLWPLGCPLFSAATVVEVGSYKIPIGSLKDPYKIPIRSL